MVFCAATLKNEAVIFHRFGESFGIADNLISIVFKFWLKSLQEGYSFGGNYMFERTTLGAWKDSAIDQDRNIF